MFMAPLYCLRISFNEKAFDDVYKLKYTYLSSLLHGYNPFGGISTPKTVKRHAYTAKSQ